MDPSSVTNPITSLELPEEDNLDPCKDIDNICHNNPRDSTLGR